MAKLGLSVIATSSSRIRDLTIADGQLIFIQDVGRIAFDYKGNRVFYNQITELETEGERVSIEDPLDGYYFVIDTAVLWFYKDGWTQVTEKPENVVCIGVEMPSLGQAKEGVLYVNKAVENISVYDSASNSYVIVADRTKDVTDDEINSLFD